MDGFDLIIFDCDGVFVDSEIIASEVESALLTEAGYPIGAEEMGERFAGMTWRNILRQPEVEHMLRLVQQRRRKRDARLAFDLQQDV
ncbi:HAD family hydrolase, partial [Rhizobium ruizarguesonis]